MKNVIDKTELIGKIDLSSGSIFTKEDIIKLINTCAEPPLEDLITEKVIDILNEVKDEIIEEFEGREWDEEIDVDINNRHGSHELKLSINEDSIIDPIKDCFRSKIEELTQKPE